MGQQFAIAFFLDAVLDPIRRTQLRQQRGGFFGRRRTDRHPQAAHGLPRHAGAIIQQVQHIVTHHRSAGIAHPQEVAPIAGRRHTDRSCHAQGNVLTAVAGPHNLRCDLDIHRALADALAQPVQQFRCNALVGRRLGRIVLDTDPQTPARRIGKAHAVGSQRGKIRPGARDHAQ